MPEAISYIRWSSQVQGKGNSRKRQEEAAEAWIKDNPGYVLNRTLSYRDEGVSGRGAQLEGALGAFLQAVKDKKIKPGTVLLVEALDRLGRMAPIDQMHLFIGIMREHIRIVTTIDRKEYSYAILKTGNGQFQLMESLIRMNVAWEESEKKSHRSNDNWERTRRGEKKKVPTRRVPGWLRVSDDGQRYELIPERARLIKEIFELTLAGWGKDRIAKKFFQDKVEPWGQGKKVGRFWRDSYVAKILANPAVIGQFQWRKSPAIDPVSGRRVREEIGEIRENHFPAAISHKLWEKVQAIRGARSKRPGRIGPDVRNLFTGLIHCGHTGHTIALANKAPHYYLKSTCPKEPKGIALKPWIYESFEAPFFECVGLLDPAELIEPSVAPEREALVEEIASLETSGFVIKENIDRLVLTLKDSRMSKIPEVTEALARNQQDRVDVTERLASTKQRLESLAGADAMTNEALASIKAIREKRHDPAFRLKLRDYMGKLVEGVFVYLDGERVFGNSVGAVYNLSRGKQAVGALRDYLLHTERKKKSESSGIRIRAFSIAFRSGATRTVMVVCKKNGPWYAVASTGGKREIVRENGLTWLRGHDKRENRVTAWEDTINLHRSDFSTEAEYHEFLRAYDEIYPSKKGRITESERKRQSDPKQRGKGRSS